MMSLQIGASDQLPDVISTIEIDLLENIRTPGLISLIIILVVPKFEVVVLIGFFPFFILADGFCPTAFRMLLP